MILIIGATGFIGSYTTRAFIEAGYEVVGTGINDNLKDCVENLGAKYVHLDITKPADFNNLPTKNIEGVILLSGLLPANAKVDIEKDENAYDYIAINTLGTINVLEYMRKNNIKKIVSTTSYADIFNSWCKDRALPDDEPRGYRFTGDHAAYVISKNAATDMIEYYSQQHGLQGATFRLPPVYGVGPHSEIYVNGKYYKTGIQTFIERAELGEPIEIWGDPNLVRDIVYVKDVADAFVKAVKSDLTHGVYNMTSSTKLTLLEQVKTVIDVFSKGKKSEIVLRPDKKNNSPSFWFDNSRCYVDFGWKPKFVNYKDMMLDYKLELENKELKKIRESRKKD